MTTQMGARAKLDILAAQTEEFRRPQSGLHRHEQQGAVPASRPCLQVRGPQQGLDFVPVEKVHRPAGMAFVRHGQDPLRQGRVLGLVRSDVAEEGTDRGQSGVARTRVVAALVLEMTQEGAEEVCVQVAEFQFRWGLLQHLAGMADQ